MHDKIRAMNFIRLMLRSPALRYIIVGGVLFLLDLAIFLFVHSVLLQTTEFSQVISRTVGATVGFAGHKWFTFRNGDSSGRALIGQSSGYVFVTIFNIFFSAWLVAILDQVLPLCIVGVKMVSEVILVVETYILLRLLFPSSKKKICNEK